MKKKIVGSFAMLAIALAVAFNVNLNMSKTNSTSLLALANVEALAESEGTGGCYWLITFHGSIDYYTCHDYYSGTYCCFT